jgi:hypothetical protein
VGVFNASTSPPKEGYAVTETNVFELTQPGTFSDPLRERYWGRPSKPRLRLGSAPIPTS